MNRNCSDESPIPHLKALTHLSIKHLVTSPDYIHEFIWADIYRYVFREFADISTLLIRTFHPHGRRAVLLLAGLEKFQKANLARTMKAKLLAHFPQKVMYSCTKKWGFTIYKYTHTQTSTYIYSKRHFEKKFEINVPNDTTKHLINQWHVSIVTLHCIDNGFVYEGKWLSHKSAPKLDELKTVMPVRLVSW